MRKDQSPFHHVVYFALYGCLITARTVEYIPEENNTSFFPLLLAAADTNSQHAALCRSARIPISSLNCQRAHYSDCVFKRRYFPATFPRICSS